MKPIYSIIIPTYNAEHSIIDCISSINIQKLHNYEILIINDGSTDNTLSLLYNIKEKNERLKILTIDNQGVSSARNRGIKEAQGEWIIFMDSDDSWDNNTLSVIDNCIKKSNSTIDLIVFNYNSVCDNQIIPHQLFKKSYYNESCKSFIEKTKKMPFEFYLNVVWNKVYRTDIIKNNNIYFQKDIKLGEDAIFNYKYLTYCQTVNILNFCLYNYKIDNKNSLSRKYTSTQEISFCYMNIYNKYIQLLKDKNISTKIYTKERGYFIGIIKNYIKLYPNEKTEFKSIIKNIRKIFPYIYIKPQNGYYWTIVSIAYNYKLDIFLDLLIRYKHHQLYHSEKNTSIIIY